MANAQQSGAAAAANIFKVPELREKILFTLLCLALYRLGAHITTPGVDVVALQTLAGQFQGTIFGIYDLFVGGGLQRATILALGIMPYISASIHVPAPRRRLPHASRSFRRKVRTAGK